MPQPAYVNRSLYDRHTVTDLDHGGVSGIQVTMPALTPGNLLVAVLAQAPSALAISGFWHITMANGIWGNPVFDDIVGNARQMVWMKFCTGGEGLVSWHISGNRPYNVLAAGVVYQFANVLNPGTATYIEAAGVTINTVTGPMNDQPVVVTGNDRLAVNLVWTFDPVSLTPNTPCGEVGGVWGFAAMGASLSCKMRLWVATMSVPGTIGGGIVSGVNTAQPRLVRGFAFAPCGGAPPAGTIIPQMMHHYIMLRGQHG